MDPHVGVQVADLPEVLTTLPAGVRLLPSVNPLVHVQMLAHGELLATDVAGVDPWFPSCVALDVSLQDGIFYEGLSTELTDVRPLASVQLHVSLQRAFPGEVLATVFAGEGLLARVGPHVNLHVPEADATDLADPAGFSVAVDVQLQSLRRVRLFSTDATATFRVVGMSFCVPHEVPFVVKGVPADLAAVRWSQTWFPAPTPDGGRVAGLVALGVSPQLSVLAEAFPAGFAAERRLSVVCLHVPLQRTGVAELLVADVAPEGLFCRVDPHMRHHVALLVEDFAADVAAEGFLSRVQPPVRLLRPDRGELLATGVTGPAAVTVRLKVQPQTVAGLQTLATQATLTLRLLQVFLHMLHQKAFPVKGLPAHPAAMRRRLFVILSLLAGWMVWRGLVVVRIRNLLWSGGSAGQTFLQLVVELDVFDANGQTQLCREEQKKPEP